ncbi:MAG TPA: hypothetical protein VGJ82_00315 [Thermoanaerobaculia bacterium]|jgi:hypothetical protein
METTVTTAGAAETAPPPPIDPANPNLTVTKYQELADEISVAFDGFVAKLPHFEERHPTTQRFVQGHLSVSEQFVASAVAAVDATEELQGVKKLDVNQARDVQQFVNAFQAIADKAIAFGRGLQFTIDSQKASLAADALQIYAISKGLVRDPGSAPLVAHVATMKRHLNRGGRKKKPAQPTPTTGATPAPASTSGKEAPGAHLVN